MSAIGHGNRRCHHCDGTGSLPPKNTGRELRKEREKAGVGQREVARLLKFSPTYICDLEFDRREWSWTLVSGYRWAVAQVLADRDPEVWP